MDNNIDQLELVRLVKKLMAYQDTNVNTFAIDLERSLRRSGMKADDFDLCTALLTGLDEVMTDVKCGIVDVLLAGSAEEAKSIVDGFWTGR